MDGNGRLLSAQENNFSEPSPVEVEVPRHSLLEVIWQRRWTMFATLILVLAAGFAYLIQATPIYTATSRLYVEQKGPKIISDVQGVMTESKNYLYTQSELLRATPILAGVLEESGIGRMKTLAGVDNRLVFLKKALDVGVGRKDDIISVSLDSPYPQEAAQIVNEIVDEYITYHSTKKRSTALEVLKILQKEKGKRDKELDEKLQAILRFKQANGALSFDSEWGNIVINRLASLSQALTNAQLASAEAKAEYETVAASQNDPEKLRQLIEAQQTNYYGSLRDTEKSELRQLYARLAERRQDLTPDAPAMKTVAARVAELTRQLAEEDAELGSAYLAVMQQRWVTAKNKEAELQAYLQEQQTLAEKLNVKAAEFAILETELKRSERLNDILDTRIKELNVTEDTGALNITILEVAKAEDEPTKPRKARVMAMALVLGLMLGVGVALLRDQLDQRLRSAEEISATLGTPVLGVVPHMSEKTTPGNRGRQVSLESHSLVAEAYRTIRTAVYFGVPNGQAKTLLVTSPVPEEGKTTLTSNLAISMAQAGQRTLVLDADFRNPAQHEIFEVKNEVGLANVLAGKNGLDEAIRRTDLESLHILPCGPIPPNPSEMLNSQAFVDSLEELSRRYDHIIIDSPPVLPVTDARILGAICHVTLLVLRAEKSTRKAAEQACESLLGIGGKILGAVVNDVRRRKGHDGYYSAYGYYRYGYGYGPRSSEKQATAKDTETAATIERA